MQIAIFSRVMNLLRGISTLKLYFFNNIIAQIIKKKVEDLTKLFKYCGGQIFVVTKAGNLFELDS